MENESCLEVVVSDSPDNRNRFIAPRWESPSPDEGLGLYVGDGLAPGMTLDELLGEIDELT